MYGNLIQVDMCDSRHWSMTNISKFQIFTQTDDHLILCVVKGPNGFHMHILNQTSAFSI